MTIFDNFISIGGDCGVGTALRNLRYKDASYPFDWSITNFQFILKCFKTDFKNMFDDLNNIKKDVNGKLTNKEGTIRFYHDYEYNELTESKRRETKNKYKRRVNRLLSLMRSNKKILFIRKCNDDSVKKLDNLSKIIKSKYPTLSFNILLFNTLNEKDTENVTHFQLTEHCFLRFSNGVYHHRHENLYWKGLLEYIKKFPSTKLYEQPKNRDS